MNKHQHRHKSENQTCMATDEYTKAVQKLCTELFWALWTSEISLNPATNPIRTSWLSPVTSEPLHSHALNVDVITPSITQKWKKFCLATVTK
jgi:hypothetical protein